MSRFFAETMPAVTVPPRLNGLPIAITQSPNLSLSESPNFTAVNGFGGLNFNTARSVFLSTPTISALILVPSFMMTLISSASAMTWLLVTTMPEVSTMKPEPSELVLCGCRSLLRSPPLPPLRFLKKSSKNSSNGEPGGNCGIAPRPSPLASMVCEVEILTTASITFSATSAIASGPRANAGAGASAATAPRQAAATSGRRRSLSALVAAVMSASLQKQVFEVHTAPDLGSGASVLVPTFRSSCSIAVPTFTNFGKLRALANLLVLVPLFYLKFLPLVVQELQIGALVPAFL